MKHFQIFIILFLCIFQISTSFHIGILRQELGVIDIHPYYNYDDNQLLNYTTRQFDYDNNFYDKDRFNHKNFRANIFGLVVLATLIAHRLNLLPN